MTVRLQIYDPSLKPAWNDFVRRSKNGTFLFEREYIEYHADRFHDLSLLCFDGDELCAVIPGSVHGGSFASHGGLTFGGVVTGERMRTGRMLAIFEALVSFLRGRGMQKLVYKAVPHIYHRTPADEDLYALFIVGARLFRRDVAAALLMSERPPYTKGRKWAVNKARKSGMTIGRGERFDEFMRIEEDNLTSKYGVRPVHTAAELSLLAGRFPENIKLFEARLGSELLGGVVIYESACVAHAQYIATTESGRELCALDALVDHLFTEFAAKRYFDFGISTEKLGRYLNTGLMDNKESYGGRAVVYDFYELDIV